MRISSIRFATWMCVLALAGCAQGGSATPGDGGGVEEFVVQLDVIGDPFAEPTPDPNDPWAEPHDPNDPWAQPQVDPNDPWAQPEQPEEPQEPQQPAPNDPWAQPQEPQQPEEPLEPEQTQPWDPWAQPQPTEPADPLAPPQQPESADQPHEPQDPPQQPAPNDPWAQPQADPWPWEQPQPTDPTTNPTTGPNPPSDRPVVPATAECPLGSADYDSDGLCDSAEAKYGTLVQNPDTDRDALSDGMEVYGIAFQGRTLDLAALGANPLRRDVFLEIDYVQGYRPHATAIYRVVDAFAAAGVALHAEVGQQIAVTPDIPVGEGEQVDIAFKQPNLDPLKAYVYRWALFAHSYDGGGSSGVAPLADTWLLVTLGNFAFRDEAQRIEAQAGTLMHELGHTFNLRHGGIEDNTNYKPNHMSVMNYHYQFSGVRRDGANVFDYSSFTVDGVSESLLSEVGAFAPGETTIESDLARYTEPLICRALDRAYDFCHTPARILGNLSASLDFNGNGIYEAGPIAADLNGNGTTNEYFKPALAEWGRLNYSAFGVIGNLNPQVNRHVARTELAKCQSAPNSPL